ncbi:MAG: GNAT family N-acetyltransferase [Clostridia bacterium]|nr:GNAT family N-acetyltransferase [Clostridia bacterium]
MIEYKIATSEDIAELMAIRLEMLREVNFLSKDYIFSEDFYSYSRDYFLNGQHTTVLAVDEKDEKNGENEKTIGCATLCYIEMMPTFSHPTGRRSHLMNVYTAPDYRVQGMARRMVEMLIEEAKRRGVTEISLDATASGRPLYRKLGFRESEECMVLVLE